MKTHELIKLLQSEDQNAEVVIEAENSFGTDTYLSVDDVYHARGNLVQSQTIITASLDI